MTVVARQFVLFGEEQAEATSDDVYTPRWVFEQLGLTFDLDVAAPPGGIPYIPAERYFTKADDALSQPWRGRVWMNPPYSDVSPWARRFLDHANGVALMCVSKANWTAEVFERADGVHLPRPFKFANEHSIFMPVFFAAMGDECVEALQNLGHVR